MATYGGRNWKATGITRGHVVEYEATSAEEALRHLADDLEASQTQEGPSGWVVLGGITVTYKGDDRVLVIVPIQYWI